VFDYDAAAPLGFADSLVTIEDGVELRAFIFESPRGGAASGVLAVPLAAGPHAGILNLTGFPVRPEPARAYAAELARRGAVVVLLWAPSTRPDGAGGGSPVTFTTADSAGQVQYVVDARRAVDVLLARADVDPARLGLVGGSYGGAIGALVAGVEPRLRAVALRVPDGGFVSYFTDPEGPGLPDDLSTDDAARWIAAMSAVEPACYVTQARASFLLQFGREDRLVSEARAGAFADRVRAEKEVRWYEAGHALNEDAAAERAEWLDRHLGTRPPHSAGGAE
jgi:dienelactone hydrolase